MIQLSVSAKVVPNELAVPYSKDLNIERLIVQLSMNPNLVNTHEHMPKIKHVTSIRTLCDILNSSAILKNLFSEVHVLLCLYLTMPLTTATAERTFSVRRRLKTYL